MTEIRKVFSDFGRIFLFILAQIFLSILGILRLIELHRQRGKCL